MRTALTLGFKENGSAEIITGPEIGVNEHQRAFNELTSGKSSKYARVELWESDGGMRRTKHFGDKGTVNFNAAHLVENQPGKGKKKSKKKLPDLTPTSGGGGGVDFNSAHPVEKQQNKKLSQKLPDLNKAQDKGATGEKSGVNWDAVTPVEDQSKSGKARTRRGGGAKTGKKSATKKAAAPKTAEKKARAEGQPDQTAKAADESKKSVDEGPTL